MPGGIFSTAKLFGMTIRESATDGSDFTNPDADYRRLFLGEDGQLHVKDSAGSVTDIGASAAPPNCYENFLTATTTVVNADTFYDGPSLTPAAGTYLVIASLVMTSSFNGATGCTMRIFDGTSAYANGQDYVSSQNAVITITRMARVTVTGSETIKAQGSSVRGSSVVSILDTTTLTGATADKASSITAMRITSV
jgi:hypothetical protein